MLIQNYKKFILKISKIYFSEKIIETNSDIDVYMQYKGNDILSGEIFFTLVIDLNNSIENIRKNIRNKYMLNQAVKKFHLQVKYINKPKYIELTDFINKYNKIATEKGFIRINFSDYSSLRNNIIISYAFYKQRIIAGHLYTYDEKRFRLTNSFILSFLDSKSIRNISGIANKYLHYSDILYAKNKKFEVYDFGGVFNLDSKTKGITKFKLGFTDNVEYSYSFKKAKTLKGKIVIFILNYFNFQTIKRAFFVIYIYLNDFFLRNKFYFQNYRKISRLYSYSNHSYKEFSNFEDASKILEYKKGDNILIFGLNSGMSIIFFKKFRQISLKLIEKNNLKSNHFQLLIKNFKNPFIEILNSEFKHFYNFAKFKYIFINDSELSLSDLKLLLDNISKYIFDSKRYFIVYFNPRYNHLFDEYEFFLIKEMKSVLSTRIHIYSNHKE